jgi:quinolinate synthase
MKRITLAGIADSLRHLQHEVKIHPAVAERARLAVTRMLAIRP